MRVIIISVMLSFVVACATSEGANVFSKIADSLKYKGTNYKHKSPSTQSWVKCTEKSVEKGGKQFNFKEYMCYQYCAKTKRRNGDCKKWVVKPYHMVKDHQLMVDRGVWTPK